MQLILTKNIKIIIIFNFILINLHKLKINYCLPNTILHPKMASALIRIYLPQKLSAVAFAGLVYPNFGL